jgi:rhamnose utilization protein RhaD (predicted bifunctional aldolase and dehydrogenase)
VFRFDNDSEHQALDSLTRLSAELGTNPLLVQAGTGNTSIKEDGVLWIKASGKWLANAGREDTFVPVDLVAARSCALNDGPCMVVSRNALTSSIETAMHAVIPFSVTLHVHSVNAIAWAVRRDGPSHLEHRLRGLPWDWVPYTLSGNPLANEVRRVYRRAPGTQVLILANHGLVICADSCEAAEQLLTEVEQRLAVQPRPIPPPDLTDLRRSMSNGSWHPAANPVIHSIATDPVSREILANGILYPCQPIFLGSEIPVVSRQPRDSLFLAIAGVGTLVSDRISNGELEILAGLAEVARRIDGEAPLRYLTAEELMAILTTDAPSYASASAYPS